MRGTTVLCALSCAGLPDLPRLLPCNFGPTSITTQKPEVPFVSTREPRKPYCLITNFGQNWGWKASSTAELQELQELIAEVDAIILDHKATLIDHPNSLALAANIR